jgi:hypothetical protein
VIKKETENILKRKDLTLEIQRMWNVKTEVIAIIIGQLEPSQNLSRLPQQHNSNCKEF